MIARPANIAVLVCAGVIAASQVALVAISPGITHETARDLAVIAPLILLVACPAALSLLLVAWLARSSQPASAMIGLALLGAFIRLIWFGSAPPVEDDFYRYLWDGAMLAHGFNPYTLSPAQILQGAGAIPPDIAQLATEGREVLKAINFPELRTIYPGTAQGAFSIAHLIAPWSLDALRVVFLAAEGATVLLLISLLRVHGLNPLWAGLYWCNPFASFTMIGIAHADALIAPFLLGALLAQIRGRFLLAAMLLGLAAGVKLWPILLAPLLLRARLGSPKRLFGAMACIGAALAITTLPLIHSTLDAGSGLTAYAGAWWNNNAIFAWASVAAQSLLPEDAAMPILRAGVAAIAAGVALAVAIRPHETPSELTRRALLVAATAFFCSPAQFPWYASWFLPLATLHRFWPLLAVSVLLPAYYLFFPTWGTPGYDFFGYGLALIHALPVLAWLVWRALHAVRPSTASHDIRSGA